MPASPKSPIFFFVQKESDRLSGLTQFEVAQGVDGRFTNSGCSTDGEVSLRVLEEAAEFEEVRDTWSAWSDGPESDPDLFSIRLRHACGLVRPHVMVVYRSGRPDCILVGWQSQGTAAFRVGSFTLFQPYASILRFVNGGFLGNQSWGNSRVLMRGIMRSLQNREIQAVEFFQLRVGSPLFDLAVQSPSVFCRDHFTPVEIHRYMTLPGSFDQFLRALSRKTRYQFKRTTRMLERDFMGQVRFQSVRSPRDVEDFARKADDISQKSFRRTLEAGFVNNLEMRETLHAAAEKSALRACLMYIGERPVAFASGILSNKTLYATFTGYDPEFKKYSPGFQSQMRLIQEAFDSSEGLLRLDAGSGDLPYKRRLFDSSWKERPVWIFAPSVKGFGLHTLRFVSTLLHSAAMRLLAESEYLRKIKKMWHQQALREFQRKTFVKTD
jgi:Acetyltransferase (GNAT) domain